MGGREHKVSFFFRFVAVTVAVIIGMSIGIPVSTDVAVSVSIAVDVAIDAVVATVVAVAVTVVVTVVVTIAVTIAVVTTAVQRRHRNGLGLGLVLLNDVGLQSMELLSKLFLVFVRNVGFRVPWRLDGFLLLGSLVVLVVL